MYSGNLAGKQGFGRAFVSRHGFKLMKKCKYHFKAEFGFNICGSTPTSTEINSKPATIFSRTAKLFVPLKLQQQNTRNSF